MLFMKPRLISSLIFILITLCNAVAFPETNNGGKEITVRITDAETKAGIPFCRMYARASRKGLLTDSAGIGKMNMPSGITRDSLICSSIGYADTVFIIRPGEVVDTLSLSMTPRLYPLEEVAVVPPRKTKTLKKGKRHASGIIVTVYTSSRGTTVAWEAGKKNRRTWLKEIQIQSLQYKDSTSRQKTDSVARARGQKPRHPLTAPVRFRINVFDASEKQRHDYGWSMTGYRNVLHEPVIFTYDVSRIEDNHFTFTLPEPLLLPETALVEIEQLDDFPENEAIIFKFNVFSKRSLIRYIDDAEWIKIPASVPFTIILLEEEF